MMNLLTKWLPAEPWMRATDVRTEAWSIHDSAWFTRGFGYSRYDADKCILECVNRPSNCLPTSSNEAKSDVSDPP